MIDFNKLDKRRTYIGLQYGTSLIAKEIKKFSKCYAPNSKEIPTHILAFVYRLGDWWIYESHAKGFKDLGVPEGVRRYKLEVWKQVEAKALNEFKIYPYKVCLKSLEHYVGQSYSMGDIRSLLKAALFKNNGKQKDRKGLICSEYIALSSSEICNFCNLPAWCITPAHFQHQIDTIGIKEIGGQSGQ